MSIVGSIQHGQRTIMTVLLALLWQAIIRLSVKIMVNGVSLGLNAVSKPLELCIDESTERESVYLVKGISMKTH